MKSKEVTLNMRVVPHTKSLGIHPLSHILNRMKDNGALYMRVNGWDKENRCWLLRIPGTIGDGFYFLAKEFEPYKEDE